MSPGSPLADAYTEENLQLVHDGCANMARHIGNARKYGVPVVVAINRFVTDTDAEIAVIRDAALAAGAFDAVPSTQWAEVRTPMPVPVG